MAEESLSATGLAATGLMTATHGRTPPGMYDEAAPVFSVTSGPWEAGDVNDKDTAQQHYLQNREITFKNSRGQPSGISGTSYRDHYPPKSVPLAAGSPSLAAGNGTFPFTASTVYRQEFPPKSSHTAVAPDRTTLATGKPTISAQTTNQHFLKAHKPSVKARPAASRPMTGDPGTAPTNFDTTYRQQYTPKEGDDRLRPGDPYVRPSPPYLASGTTYGAEFLPKELALVPRAPPSIHPGTAPFEGGTTYAAEYTPKAAQPDLPHLTGLRSRQGIQLSLPRKSLGVEFWHRGVNENYYVFIPRTVDAPCTARQVFTTVHDNQDQACILVLYGDSNVASENTFLGQFDIVNIPPAPRDVPSIEVIFRLDRNLFLTVEARDLDTQRQKRWLQSGDIVVLKD